MAKRVVAKKQLVKAKDREAWRAWLEKNHASSQGVWLVYYKKSTGKPSVRYDAAVEEALCFGWIDSTVQSIDDERYMQQFTPRRDVNNWSDLNKRRIAMLIASGRMTPPGIAKLGNCLEKPPRNGSLSAHGKREKAPPPRVPAPIKKAFQADAKAWAFFQRLAPSYKRGYLMWINTAKREETRQKRIARATTMLAQGVKSPYFG